MATTKTRGYVVPDLDHTIEQSLPMLQECFEKVAADLDSVSKTLNAGIMSSIDTSRTSLDLTANHHMIFAKPEESSTADIPDIYRLPRVDGDTILVTKIYKFKNIGAGLARIISVVDDKIEGNNYLDLYPGDRCELVFDGAEWQTV